MHQFVAVDSKCELTQVEVKTGTAALLPSSMDDQVSLYKLRCNFGAQIIPKRLAAWQKISFGIRLRGLSALDPAAGSEMIYCAR
jgi:hypothetical protein